MTDFLVERFIKNSDSVNDPGVRASYGMLSGIVGIICNLILFLLKFMAGILTGAVSVSADAFNNLSDAGSSIITFIGFKMAGKPADTSHPYGHGRIEYISGLIVAMIIVVMAVELLEQSVDRIINPKALNTDTAAIMILAASILVKLWICMFNRGLGKKITSAAILATAADSLSDCISTSVVLISLLVSKLWEINIDGYAGVIVAVFVFMAGIDAAKDTLQPLLGQPPEKSFVEALEKMVMEDANIIGVHDLVVHNYGPGRLFASIHAEVPYNVDVLKAHDVIDLAEQKVKEQLGCEISIHMDPVVTDDEQINELKAMTLRIIEEINPVLKMHDFRVTKGPYIINLIFDVVAPYDFELTDDNLKNKISQEISAQNKMCRAVINIDKAIIES